MTWFQELMGFSEENPDQVRENIEIKGKNMISKVNGCSYQQGHLEVISLAELKSLSPSLEDFSSKITVEEIVGNIQEIHLLNSSDGAFFQAASQFNLLEMAGPSIRPEQGVGIYENDFTQGPACAIACGAGTIYRNYFVDVDGQIGQSEDKQIDCLKHIGDALLNENECLWTMSNGYALATKEGLQQITKQLTAMSKDSYEKLKEKLCIGIQWNTQVTLGKSKNCVTQAYCSALPVAYSSIDVLYWREFSQLILEALYEATFYAALINYTKTQNKNVYLTLVGGGAFGNDISWILSALKKAIVQFSNTPLQIKIVSYGRPKNSISELIKELAL